MVTNKRIPMQPEGDNLFDRVVSILEQARSNIVRAVNNNMVIAYWLIGREIIQEIQAGDERAEYGKQVIEQLSAKLNHKYSRGFSTTICATFEPFTRSIPVGSLRFATSHVANSNRPENATPKVAFWMPWRWQSSNLASSAGFRPI